MPNNDNSMLKVISDSLMENEYGENETSNDYYSADNQETSHVEESQSDSLVDMTKGYDEEDSEMRAGDGAPPPPAAGDMGDTGDMIGDDLDTVEVDIDVEPEPEQMPEDDYDMMDEDMEPEPEGEIESQPEPEKDEMEETPEDIEEDEEKVVDLSKKSEKKYGVRFNLDFNFPVPIKYADGDKDTMDLMYTAKVSVEGSPGSFSLSPADPNRNDEVIIETIELDKGDEQYRNAEKSGIASQIPETLEEKDLPKPVVAKLVDEAAKIYLEKYAKKKNAQKDGDKVKWKDGRGIEQEGVIQDKDGGGELWIKKPDGTKALVDKDKLKKAQSSDGKSIEGFRAWLGCGEEKEAVSPPGWKGTVDKMKERHSDEIDNPYALSYWMKGEGYKPHFKDPRDRKKKKSELTIELNSWIKKSYIRKKGNEWCVYSKSGSELGCHPTKEKAKKQLAAIEISKHNG